MWDTLNTKPWRTVRELLSVLSQYKSYAVLSEAFADFLFTSVALVCTYGSVQDHEK